MPQRLQDPVQTFSRGMGRDCPLPIILARPRAERRRKNRRGVNLFTSSRSAGLGMELEPHHRGIQRALIPCPREKHFRERARLSMAAGLLSAACRRVNCLRNPAFKKHKRRLLAPNNLQWQN